MKAPGERGQPIGDTDPQVAEAVPTVELEGISKSFYGVVANDSLDLDLFAGEIHALLGENGAGKTTLCSILAGLYRQDAGTIRVGGLAQHFHSPRDALASGIGMVYQHFRLVDSFTVAENLALGHPRAGVRLSTSTIEREAADLCEQYGIPIEPQARVRQLSVGEQQRVEILKLLYRGVEVLILDEPTAVLTPQESKALFSAMKAISDQGKVVVFVSHKLKEVIEVSDRITVLRDGKRVGQAFTRDSDSVTLAKLMVGRELPTLEWRHGRRSGDVVLSVRGLQVMGDRGNQALNGLDLEVGVGEIVGVAGVAGNGQRELSESLAGLRPAEEGTIYLDGLEMTGLQPAERIKQGVAFVPEDRLQTGVASGLSVEENLVLKSYRSARFSRGPLISKRAINSWAAELVERFDIRGVRPGFPVSLLSGGNLQRTILARELSHEPRVLIAASPTRGLDVGATNTIRRILLEERERGTGVLLISEDLEEIQALSDRILVIFEGRIVGQMRAEEFEPERIGLMMAGHID